MFFIVAAHVLYICAGPIRRFCKARCRTVYFVTGASPKTPFNPVALFQPAGYHDRFDGETVKPCGEFCAWAGPAQKPGMLRAGIW